MLAFPVFKASKWSLGRIFLMIIIFSLVLSMAAVYWGGYSYLSGYLKNEIVKKNELLVNIIAYGIENTMTLPRETLYEMALNSQYTQDMQTISDHLQIQHQSHSIFETLIILDTEGRVLGFAPYSDKMIGLDMSRQEFFKDLGRRETWSKSHLSPESGNVTVTVSRRYDDMVFVANINLKGLAGIFSINKVDKDSFQVLLDRDGTILAHEDQNKVSTRENMSLIKEIRELREGELITQNIEYEGKAYITSLYKLPGIKWIVGYFNNVENAFSPLYRLRIISFVTLLLTLTIAIGISVLILRKVNKTIARVTDYAIALEDGEYQTSPPLTMIYEFDILLEQLQKTAGSVQAREKDLQRDSELIP